MLKKIAIISIVSGFIIIILSMAIDYLIEQLKIEYPFSLYIRMGLTFIAVFSGIAVSFYIVNRSR